MHLNAAHPYTVVVLRSVQKVLVFGIVRGIIHGSISLGVGYSLYAHGCVCHKG